MSSFIKNGREDRTLAACVCTVDELESLLSRDFFCDFPDGTERVVESVVNWDSWGSSVIYTLFFLKNC